MANSRSKSLTNRQILGPRWRPFDQPISQPPPNSSPTSLGWHLLGTTAQLLRHVNLHGLRLRLPTFLLRYLLLGRLGRRSWLHDQVRLTQHVMMHVQTLGWSSKCRGLRKAMLNKSRIGIWLIWLQVVFVAQQQACSLKKVANYRPTMKRKNFPAGLWNALLLPTESGQFKIFTVI